MSVTVENDLRHLFGLVRDQGKRPTCLAFATSDTHAALRAPWTPLSCEYIYYHAQKRGNRHPSAGATMRDMLDALRHDGQPEESGWAYLAPPIDPKAWRPPAKLAPLFRRGSDRNSNKTSEIIAQLNSGKPVVVAMTLSIAFFRAKRNDPIDGIEPPDIAHRHAVVAVANGTNTSERVVLVRNSWGTRWGDHGHAWITERYLEPRILELAILKENINVPHRSAAA